jgi:diguanylate cyclase (GGDEF)-like protein/PAS domain S-box-containing protein
MSITNRLNRLALLMFAITVGLCSFYWWQLMESHRQTREKITRQTEQHAGQFADAVAQQISTLVRSVDYALREMRDDYASGDMKELENSKRFFLDSFPTGSIAHIGVINSDGYLIWSNLDLKERLYLGDREHFKEHLTNGEDHLFISKPVFGRLSKKWTIQLSRPILRKGRTIGVMLISISPDYLGSNLAVLSPAPGDVISLLRADGTFLARSKNTLEAMGKAVPAERPFLAPYAPAQGTFEAQGMMEQTPRIFGWRRLDDFPLIINFGVAKSRVMSPLDEEFASSRLRNGIGIGFILILSGGIIRLLMRLAAAHGKVASNEGRLRAVFDSASDAITISDSDNKITAVNPAFTSITGYRAEEVIGRNPSLLSSGQHSADFYKEMWQQLLHQDHWEGEIINCRKDGLDYVEWLKISVIRDSNGHPQHYVALFSDITDRKRKEENVWRQANFDGLTGLPNRQLFEDRLNLAITQAERRKTSVALLFIDLDRFKPVNDELGHAAGDALLQQVAQRLGNLLREEDTVARIGGDEFVAVLPDLRVEEAHTRAADKIVKMLRDPFHIGDRFVEISCSVGVALFPRDANNIEALVAKADAAMYRAKQAGGSTWRE